jgi:4-hydroxy-tetrahydrodipicolinate reductase
MGTALQDAVRQNPNLILAGGSARQIDGTDHLTTAELLVAAFTQKSVDLIIDFSGIDGNQTLVEALETLSTKNQRLAVLVGTTGLSPEDLARWKKLPQRVLIAPNTSLGILKLAKAAQVSAPALYHAGFDIEITETHHNRKKDAPSGTALFLAEAIREVLPELELTTHRDGVRSRRQLGLHAIRGGGVVGEHDIRFISDTEEVKLSHRAFSRSLFAEGALHLGLWLTTKPAGQQYKLLDVDL